MTPSMEIVSAGSHVSTYLLYFLNRGDGWRSMINKEQASSTSLSMHLLKPILYPLENLGWGISYVCCIYDRDNIREAEGAMLKEGEVEGCHWAYFGISLLSESRTEPFEKLGSVLMGHFNVRIKYRLCDCDFVVQRRRLTIQHQPRRTRSGPFRGRGLTSVVSHANIYNWSRGANGGIFRAALPRLTLRMMSFADFVQTKGFGSALLCSM